MQTLHKIIFKPMQDADVPVWQTWIAKPYIKALWFMDGYETADYIYEKIKGNGYDFPYMTFLDNKPIGYIQCCDLYAYRTLCPEPKGLFTHEEPGTFCMDLFIGEENFLDKGYGTQIVKTFLFHIFEHFNAKTVLIDPAKTNKRAIRCYEKAGFKFVREAFDGVTTCHVMAIERASLIGCGEQK